MLCVAVIFHPLIAASVIYHSLIIAADQPLGYFSNSIMQSVGMISLQDAEIVELTLHNRRCFIVSKDRAIPSSSFLLRAERQGGLPPVYSQAS